MQDIMVVYLHHIHVLHFCFVPVVAGNVTLKRYHNVLNQQVEVELVGSVPEQAPFIPPGTILVKGLGSSHNEQILELYFSNPSCGGGEITQVTIKGNDAYVTFANPQGNILILLKLHDCSVVCKNNSCASEWIYKKC